MSMDKVELAHNREIKELDWLEHLKKVNPDKIDKELFEKIFKTKTLHIRKRVDDYSVRVRVVIDIIYEKHTNTGWCHTNWWCVAFRVCTPLSVSSYSAFASRPTR